MNDVAIVGTAAGMVVVLRGHRRQERHRVEFEHQVMAFARSRGVPVPAAIPTPAGNLVVDHDGQLYSLFEEASGYQVERDDLGVALAETMGKALANLHAALRFFPLSGSPRASRCGSYQDILAKVSEILAVVARREDGLEQDAWAIERLRSRAEWLRGRPDPAVPVPDDEQLVHGDYQESNLFFQNGEVSSVIDWDKAEVRSPREEVMRALDLSLRLDPALCRAFLGGYGSISPITVKGLDDAAALYAYGRACDLWLFETIYLKGDDRPRRFITPGTFTPFLDAWEAVREALL